MEPPKDFSETPLYLSRRVRLNPPQPTAADNLDLATILFDKRDLVAALRELYPPRCRRLDEPEREHERYAGKVELIDELESLIRVRNNK